MSVKIITYVSGVLSCILIIFGSLIKILHLPGANELLMLGMTLLAVIYVPSLAIYWYRRQ
jgi:hypothetical protein